jgi:hypothetical protein
MINRNNKMQLRKTKRTSIGNSKNSRPKHKDATRHKHQMKSKKGKKK